MESKEGEAREKGDHKLCYYYRIFNKINFKYMVWIGIWKKNEKLWKLLTGIFLYFNLIRVDYTLLWILSYYMYALVQHLYEYNPIQFTHSAVQHDRIYT